MVRFTWLNFHAQEMSTAQAGTVQSGGHPRRREYHSSSSAAKNYWETSAKELAPVQERAYWTAKSAATSAKNDSREISDLFFHAMRQGTTMNTSDSSYIALAADIVSAYVSNNSIRSADLSELINSVHAALTTAASGKSEAPAEELRPAVPVKKSVTPEYIVCLEDGKKFKSLKRHLRTAYDMTPDQYRAKWGLPSDYPMVAPSYAQARSNLAKTMGLGQKRRKKPEDAEGTRRGRKAA
jgi:predicted transcriptional regulator